MTSPEYSIEHKHWPAEMANFIAKSPAELQHFGARVASALPARALVILSGPLGAGKTTLTKGMVAALELAPAEQVTSPTYTLVHEYHGAARSLYHIDLYRLDTPAQLETLGLDELLERQRSVIVIEWGEKFMGGWPRPLLHLELSAPTPTDRRAVAQWLS